MTQSHANARTNPVSNPQPTDPPTDEISQAELIRRLRRQCDMEAAHIAELKEQIKTLRAERDEARRIVCEMQAAKEQGTPEGWADEWGWDCFRNTTEPPLVSDESAGRLE